MKKISQNYLSRALFFSLLLLGNDLYADETPEKENTRNPLGCYEVGYAFNLKTLKLQPRKVGASQSLYVLFNKSNQTINLFQMRDEDSARSTYLNHTINAKQWSVLATNEPMVKYICSVAEGKSSYGRIVDCQDALQVCEYTNVKYGLNNQGNYWIVNSFSKNDAVRAIVRYGIIPSLF